MKNVIAIEEDNDMGNNILTIEEKSILFLLKLGYSIEEAELLLQYDGFSIED